VTDMTTVPTTPAELASFIDHTLLKPEATDVDVIALVEEGARLGCFSVCVSPTFDMVIDVGAAKASDFEAVEADIAAVRAAVPGDKILKVIIESSALDDDEIVAVCRAAEAAGADYVKTSTGFHPTGGATVHTVSLMAETVGGRLGVKASGGIRTLADALGAIEAGATRLGMSGAASVLAAMAGEAEAAPSSDY